MKPLILLVEDHDDNRAVIKRRLERRGHEVVEADDGASAVEAYAKHKPQLIIMDLSMPNMSGFDALARIRELDEEGCARCIAVTAHSMQSIEERCAQVGFDGFLAKPIDFGLLSDEIDRHLSASD